MLPATLLEVKRKILIAEISVLYAPGRNRTIKWIDPRSRGVGIPYAMLSAERYRFHEDSWIFAARGGLAAGAGSGGTLAAGAATGGLYPRWDSR